MKLIMENWRKFINEVDFNQDGTLQPDELRGLATKLEKEKLMAMISDRIREVGGTTEKPDENRPEATPTEEDFDYAKEELCDENSNLCGEIMPIGYEEFLYFEENKNKENLNEQVNTRLIKRLQDFRETAARQNKWDLVDACHDLLEKDGPNFVRFGEKLQSAFASSSPGEMLNVTVNAIRSCHKELKADIDNDGIPDKIELSRQG